VTAALACPVHVCNNNCNNDNHIFEVVVTSEVLAEVALVEKVQVRQKCFEPRF